MSQKSELQLANFICKYREKDLLDYPKLFAKVFFNGPMVRKFKDTKYILKDIQLVSIGDGIEVVAGRFIKDLFLHREQVYRDDGILVSDARKMQSSPSALFFLVLNDHRLLYFHESSYAPSLHVFESSVRWFFKDVRRKRIDNILLSDTEKVYYARKYERKITRSFLNDLIPDPEIKVIPISSAVSLKAFVEKFSILRRVRVSIYDTNNELDTDAMFQALREQKQRVKGERTVLEHVSKEGLDKDEVATEFSDLTSLGNNELVFKGVGLNGNAISGNNNDFSIKVPIGQLPRDMQESARRVYDVYAGLLANKTVGKQVSQGTVDEKIKKLKRVIDDAQE
ncbi:MAG TPA: hypothetical protein PKC79_01325 [Solidesulfovibrio magneticus]|nr:hypothetical protein [Solidesulfovibrio magneticus]